MILKDEDRGLLNPKRKFDTKYKNKFRPKNAETQGKHLGRFRFKKGESGHDRIGKRAEIDETTGKVVWVDDPAKAGDKEKFAHLHRWEQGESGNPAGKPKGATSVVAQLKAYLNRHPEEVMGIVAALVKEGKMGNIIATKEIMDRVDGRVAETHRIEGELPVTLRFVPASIVLEGRNQDVIEGQAIEVKQIEEGENDL